MQSYKGNTPSPRYQQQLVPRGERPLVRTSAGLRNALFDEIDALRRGDGDPQRAQAVAQLAKGILATAKLEYQFKQAGIPDSTPIAPLLLGDTEEPGDEIARP